MAVVISIFSSFIMQTYGKGFTEGNIVLIILAFSTILTSINGVVGQAIVGKGKMWTGLSLNFIWGIIALSSTYFFLELGYGAKGLAFALLLSYSIHTLTQFIFLNKFNNKSID